MSKLSTMLQVGRTFGVRDGMLRLQYELQRSTGMMSLRMRSAQGWNRWSLDRIAPDVTPAEMLSALRKEGRFFFTDAITLGKDIRKTIGPDSVASVLAEAEQVLRGNLPYFGRLQFSSGFPPQWFQNPVTGQRVSPQRAWTQMRFASSDYGDLKFILEPSRFSFVYPLARAYALSGEERFLQAFWSAVESWARESPPMNGPLWICGQESSLRILALSFALHAFINSSSTTDDRTALLVSMIASHAWRTAQTIGYARSQRSNHLISEAVGLWTAGTLYPELKDAQTWQKLGAELLREAVLDQISPEGVSHQHSFNYQRMILHLLLWTLRLAEIRGVLLHEDIRDRAGAAYDFIRQWVDPSSGLVPNYGSDDGSLLFPLAVGSYRDYRPLLQLGAAVLDRPALGSGVWDEAALWFGLKPAPGKITDSLRSAADNTGYFRLGNRNSWALIRAGKYHRRPFQADQLHVDLWWKGINLAHDPGTYLYNGEFPWNNGFARTVVHNTVTIDHQDQMRRAGRFLWVDWAQASGKTFASRGGVEPDCFEGHHDGYKLLGITHRRRVEWLSDCGWIIVDDVEGSGEHHVQLHWLGADLPFEVSASPFRVTFTSGGSRIGWNIFSSAPGQCRVIRAGKEMETSSPAQDEVNPATSLLGWHSPTYGDLQPAVSMVYETRSQLPVRFVTVILTNENCKLDVKDGEIVLSVNQPSASRQESEIYRVHLSPGTKQIA